MEWTLETKNRSRSWREENSNNNSMLSVLVSDKALYFIFRFDKIEPIKNHLQVVFTFSFTMINKLLASRFRKREKKFRFTITVNNCRFCKLYFFFSLNLSIVMAVRTTFYYANVETGNLLNRQLLTLRKNTQINLNSAANWFQKRNPNENFE